MLITLTHELLQTGHGTLRRIVQAGRDPERWLSHQTSVHLKGILWKSLEAEPFTLILDGVEDSSYAVYRFMQRIYFAKGMAVIAASRDPAVIGPLGRLFWDPQRSFHLRPLALSDAGQLFDLAADRYGLRSLNLDLEDFREKVLDAAGGNPGQIVEMCRLATKPQYATGRHIKFAPLRIDAMLGFLS